MSRKKKPIEAIEPHDLFPVTAEQRIEMQAELLEKELEFDGLAEQLAHLADDANSLRGEQKKLRGRIMNLVRTLKQEK